MPEDRTLMRLKDGALLLIALGGLFAGMNKFYQLPSRLAQMEKTTEDRAAKYIPLVEKHENTINVIMEQNRQVIERLTRIERKMDR